MYKRQVLSKRYDQNHVLIVQNAKSKSLVLNLIEQSDQSHVQSKKIEQSVLKQIELNLSHVIDLSKQYDLSQDLSVQNAKSKSLVLNQIEQSDQSHVHCKKIEQSVLNRIALS